MGQEMGLRSVTIMQGVSVTPHSSFFLDWAMHTTGNNNNNNRRLVTLAEHTSDHGRQTNSSTEEKGEQV